MIFIYGLFDPRNYQLRYIGKTKHTMGIRISQHIHEAKKDNKTHKDKWIQSLLRDGIKPSFEILEECTEENWEEIEQAWIADCYKLGLKLTNQTIGGDGMKAGRKLSPEHIEKIRQANTGKKYPGRKHSEEVKRKMSETRKGKPIYKSRGRKLTDETKRKLADASRGRIPSDEVRQKISERRKGIPVSEETREKLRVANLGKKASEETKQKMSQSRQNISDETRLKLSQSRMGNKNALDSKHSEETRKKVSEASKRMWAKRKAQNDN